MARIKRLDTILVLRSRLLITETGFPTVIFCLQNLTGIFNTFIETIDNLSIFFFNNCISILGWAFIQPTLDKF